MFAKMNRPTLIGKIDWIALIRLLTDIICCFNIAFHYPIVKHVIVFFYINKARFFAAY